MSIEAYFPTSGNLSYAWAQSIVRLLERGVDEISPLVVAIDEFQADGSPVEDSRIRSRLEAELEMYPINGKPRLVAEVASTIFPISMWNPKLGNSAERLYERYLESWPRIQKRDSLNARGQYFQRLISFGLTHNPANTVNQLDKIVAEYKSGLKRRSAFQAAIFDPLCDHRNQPRMNFPCLQQVAFTPTSKGLVVSGYYVIQYMLERGYGNYLGLCWLGRFMAHQFGMPLVKMNCFITVAVLGNAQKTKLNELRVDLSNLLNAQAGKS